MSQRDEEELRECTGQLQIIRECTAILTVARV